MTRLVQSVVFALIAIALAIPALPAPVQGGISPADVINTAGRQRMLTQRIIRAYVQVGLGANAAVAGEQMTAAIARFEQEHAWLLQMQLPEHVRDALHKVGDEWLRLKLIVEGENTRAAVGDLTRVDNELLLRCEDVVSLLEDLSGTRQGRLVNISGRQRMLSQRIVKNYMLLSAGLDMQQVAARLRSDRAEFRKALNTLMSERNYSTDITATLDDVSEQWIWIESALDTMMENHYPIIVADSGEKILVLLERLTNLYAVIEGGAAEH